MKFILNNRQLPILLLIIISSFFLLLSYLPNFYEASVVDLLPKNRTMVWGEHIYTYDYNVYLSKIRQGQEGRWRVVDKYDNHPEQKGILLQMFYLLAGKIGGLFRFDPTLTFHLLRTILSIGWVFTIIVLNIYFLKKPIAYIAGTLMSLLATSFPIFYLYEGQTWVGMYMNWWQEMDVVKRISYIPHYLANYIGVGILTLLLFIFHKTKKPKYFIFISVIEFFLFFIHPSGALVFLASWFIFHLIHLVLFRSYKKEQIIRIGIYSFILLLISAVPVLYIKWATSFYPWKSLIDFDQKYRLPFTFKEYILALGPVFFSGIFGLLVALKKKEEKMMPVITWLLGAFSGIALFTVITNIQSPARFVQTANHVPLAILSAYFFLELSKKYRRAGKALSILSVISIVSIGILQSYFSIKGQIHFIRQRAMAVFPLVPYPSQVMYPLNDFWNAIKWLEYNTKEEQIVLSKYTAGNYIPAYAGNFVYYGHEPESPNYDNRITNVDWFFSGVMTKKEALDFMQKEHISYVFYGPQEKERAYNDINQYGFLKPVFQSEYVIIYKVD